MEALTEIPKPVVQTIEKQIPRIELRAQERIVEVPTTLQVEQPVEVPQVLIAEQIRQVPEPEVQYVDREVPNVTYQPVEQIVEVPQVVKEERLVEVPQVQLAEFVKQVPKQQIREVPKHIPRVETRCVEKIQSVPVNLLHEVAVEVPQVLRHEVITEVQGQQTEQRVVQTAQEVERRVNRSEVVVGSESERFQGAYDAKVVRVEAPTPSNYSDTYLNEGLVIRSKSPTPTRARLVAGSAAATGTVTPLTGTLTPQPMDLFSRIDANHDGVVSREEFAKAFQGSSQCHGCGSAHMASSALPGPAYGYRTGGPPMSEPLGQMPISEPVGPMHYPATWGQR